MKYDYIAIESECGSGGQQIARMLSEEMGIPCYGKEILETAAEMQGLTIQQVMQAAENDTEDVLYSLCMIGQAIHASPGEMPGRAGLFAAIRQTVCGFASDGPAVFIGHCAGSVLRDLGRVLHVFITSDQAAKVKYIAEQQRISEQEALAVAKRHDRRQAAYYRINTGKRWADHENYDLVLDSSELGHQGCVGQLTAVLCD